MDGRSFFSLASSLVAFALFIYAVRSVFATYRVERARRADETRLPRHWRSSQLLARLAFGMGALIMVLALTATAASWPLLGKYFQAL